MTPECKGYHENSNKRTSTSKFHVFLNEVCRMAVQSQVHENLKSSSFKVKNYGKFDTSPHESQESSGGLQWNNLGVWISTSSWGLCCISGKCPPNTLSHVLHCE